MFNLFFGQLDSHGSQVGCASINRKSCTNSVDENGCGGKITTCDDPEGMTSVVEVKVPVNVHTLPTHWKSGDGRVDRTGDRRRKHSRLSPRSRKLGAVDSRWRYRS